MYWQEYLHNRDGEDHPSITAQVRNHFEIPLYGVEDEEYLVRPAGGFDLQLEDEEVDRKWSLHAYLSEREYYWQSAQGLCNSAPN
jgi:hypothetical protein